MPKHQTYLKAKQVEQLTGWNRNQRNNAVRNEQLSLVRFGSSIFYVLESIPEIFIKKSA